MRARLACRLLIALACAAPVASADAEAERVRLYQEAQRLGAEGEWEQARQRLERVVEIRSAPKALIALAYAELQLGRLLRARQLYTRARDDARGAAIKSDIDAAQLGLDHVSRRIPKLVLMLPANVAPHEVRVTVDTKPVIVRDGVVEVDPGERSVVVAALGRVPSRATVTAIEAQRVPVQVEFQEQSDGRRGAEVEPESTVTTADDGSLSIGPIILGGAGLVATAVGVVVWLGGNSDYQSVVDECGGDGARCPASKQGELVPRADDARDRIITGQIVAGVGAAVVAGAAIWWLASGSSERTTTRPGVFVGVAPVGRGVAGAVGGSF